MFDVERRWELTMTIPRPSSNLKEVKCTPYVENNGYAELTVRMRWGRYLSNCDDERISVEKSSQMNVKQKQNQ